MAYDQLLTPKEKGQREFEHCNTTARREKDGSVRIVLQDMSLRAMARKPGGSLTLLVSAESAHALREQLTVALLVPAPERPIDPPSRL